MISIVNVDANPRPRGWHEYVVRVNQDHIAGFRHRREDGLATCLMKAAEAVTLASAGSNPVVMELWKACGHDGTFAQLPKEGNEEEK